MHDTNNKEVTDMSKNSEEFITALNRIEKNVTIF
jgi:hypothetical protein